MAACTKVSPVPDAVRALGSLEPTDYCDGFAVALPDGAVRSAEEWSRGVFEAAPSLLRSVLRVGWRVGLGLHLAPPGAPGHVLGWPIVGQEPSSVVLEQRSWLLTAQLVFFTGEGRLLLATLVRYDRARSGWIWRPASVIHRRVIPYLLVRTTRQLTRRDSS